MGNLQKAIDTAEAARAALSKSQGLVGYMEETGDPDGDADDKAIRKGNKYSNWYRDKIIIECRDVDGQLEKLLADIREQASIGHSFSVVVDPDEEGGRSYFIDGDGSFDMKDIKVEKKDKA